MTELSDAAPASAARDIGFIMPFKATVKPLALDLGRVPPLLARFREIVEQPSAPADRQGCKDCQKLDGLVVVMGSSGA